MPPPASARWWSATAPSGRPASYQGILVSVYGSLLLLVRFGLLPIAAGAALLTSPIAAWQFWSMRRGDFRDSTKWESIAFWSVALLVLTSALELVGFVVAARAF